MTPADKLLDHFDRIAGTEPRFVQVSDAGVLPVRTIAGIIQFAHVRELFEYFDHSEKLEGDAWWEARRRFPLSIHADRH